VGQADAPLRRGRRLANDVARTMPSLIHGHRFATGKGVIDGGRTGSTRFTRFRIR
jgi:hypothetical protein